MINMMVCLIILYIEVEDIVMSYIIFQKITVLIYYCHDQCL